jgi:hypothetical protein
MNTLAQVNDSLRSCWGTIDQGVLIGVLVGAVLPLCFYLVLGLILRRRRRCRGVRIPGEGGVLFVSVAAVREFVRRLVHEFDDAAFHALELERRGPGYVFNVSIDVAPAADMVALRTQINEHLREEAARRMGLVGTVLEVNVVIHRLLANERKWRRQRGEPAAAPEGDEASQSVEGR